MGRHGRPHRRRRGLPPGRRRLCRGNPARAGRPRRLAGARPRLPGRHPPAGRRRDGGPAAHRRPPLPRRALHPHGRQGRAAARRPRHGRRRPPPGRHHPGGLRRPRPGLAGGPGGRRHHGTRAHRLRRRGAGRRRLVPPVLRQPGRRLPATEGAGVRAAHRADGRAGDDGGRPRLGVPPAGGRRLHHRAAQQHADAHRSRQLPPAAAVRRIVPAEPAGTEVAAGRPFPAGMAHPPPLAAGPGLPVRGRARPGPAT